MVTNQVISVMTANPAPYGVTPAVLAALGADIYVKLDGPPPTDASQCTFLTTDSKTPYMAEYGRHRRRQNGPLHAPLANARRHHRRLGRNRQRNNHGLKEFSLTRGILSVMPIHSA